MQLSKRTPARKKTVKFNWCRKDYKKMSEEYRDIRRTYRDPMDACFWCNHKFVNGEMMALAQPEKGSNKILCRGCADGLMENRDG